MRSYRLAVSARKDLDSIWLYVAEHGSPEIASRLLDELEATFRIIASQPSIGVLDKTFGSEHIRKFTKLKCIIYYRSIRGRVSISRVLHGARLQTRALHKKPL